MRIFDTIAGTDELSMAIGFFDGVHLGHCKVIKNAIDYAHKLNIKSAVLTFSESPSCVLQNIYPSYITPMEKRLKLIENLGVDVLYLLNFDKDYSTISAENFLENLVSTLNIKAITTGFNFNFGHKKSGDSTFLFEKSNILNYKYFNIEAINFENTPISSTNIRMHLNNNNFLYANKMLGYEFNFDVIVKSGKHIASTFNTPTANFDYPNKLLKLKRGVYSVDVIYKDTKYSGIMNLGLKPTIENVNDIYSGEVHIFDFNENIYNKKINIIPKKFVRPEKKFESLDALKTQILNDINTVKFNL